MDKSCVLMEDIDTLLLDIEGTTTPISFVHDTLFPYAKENMDNFLHQNWFSDDVVYAVKSLEKQANLDIASGLDNVPVVIPAGKTRSRRTTALESVKKNVLWQMSLDRKSTALKNLQGLIWRDAYQSGKIKGEVFKDVKPALEKLRLSNLRVFIYSSGSVKAQKLLFEYSKYGNMLPLLDGHFDTTVGNKRDKRSYEKIAKDVSREPSQILFLTDIPEEADAAIAAGLNACIVLRPGNKTVQNLKFYKSIKTFEVLVK